MEIAAPWTKLPAIYDAVRAAILEVDNALVASAHQSHSYPDGGCLYFTFAARPPVDQKDACYRAMWDAGVAAVLAHGGALSHHHGVGLHRGRYVAQALGEGFGVLCATKKALDPNGILNPGKLGLPSPWGPTGW
jgi:alkyldihydroxyacetonephosphate synthase